MSPDYAASVLCEFNCNGRFSLASVILPLCDFPPVRFAGLVKIHNHPVCALIRLGCSIFLACKAGCKPNVLENGSVPFCVGSGDSLIDVTMQAGPDAFIIASSICVLCRPDPAVHFCQLRVGDNLCQMFGRRVKCKWEPRVNLIIVSHLEFVVIAYEQEPTNCWGFNAICAVKVNTLLRHSNLDDNKDCGRCSSVELIGAQRY